MSSDPIPFPVDEPAVNGQTVLPYIDPMKFEAEVLKVCNPAPEIRQQLLMFCRRYAPGTSVIRGETDGYNWRTGVLTLAKETAKGEGMRALLTVAHECAHAQQKRDWPWLPWWSLKVPIIRLFLEDNAWSRALTMLT